MRARIIIQTPADYAAWAAQAQAQATAAAAASSTPAATH
jgi:heme/copper-type cytochrome/quinol oxidase subunit 2